MAYVYELSSDTSRSPTRYRKASTARRAAQSVANKTGRPVQIYGFSATSYTSGDPSEAVSTSTVHPKGARRSNPRAIKLPSKFTPAEVRVNEQGKVQIRINPAKLGSGGRFVKCVESVEAKGGAIDPRAVCATAGRKKYGAKKFAAMGRAGRKRAQRSNPHAGIGFTDVNADHYELIAEPNERRVKQRGTYRHYATKSEAETAARKVAKARKTRYIGEVR